MVMVQADPPSTVFAQTDNLDEFQEIVVGLLRPFALSAGRGPYDARLRHSSVAGLGLTTIEYGDEVEISTHQGSFAWASGQYIAEVGS